MQALQRQNELFKNYISSLEKENDARNIERTTLFNQIDRMTLEIDRLNALLSKSNSRVISNTGNSSEKELKSLSDANATLRKEIETLKAKINQHVLDISNRDKQISTLTSQKQGYLLEIKTLRETQTQSVSTNNKIILLESEINSYKIKISQISTLEQSLKTSNSRILELQNTNKRLEIDFKRIEADFKRQQLQYKKLQTENRQLKLNSKPSSQASTLLSAKLNLEATVRQLSSKIEWLQTSIKTAEQQKSSFQKRSRQLQRQLLEVKGKLTQYRFNDDNIRSLQNNLSVKEKQMEALEQMINSLKENKKYLEKNLKEKDEIINKTESQLYVFKTSKSDDQILQRELFQLREGKKMAEQQIEGYIRMNRQLESQLINFQQMQHNQLNEINNLRSQRQKLLQQIDMQSSSLDQAHKQIQSYRSRSPEQPKIRIQSDAYYKQHIPERQEEKQDDLRMIVSTLKQQVQFLKASQFKSRVTTQANNKWESANQNNSNLKQYLAKNTKSPQKITHSKLLVGHDRDKRSANNQVWQNLQRKIQVLRSENQTLKKSLFD